MKTSIRQYSFAVRLKRFVLRRFIQLDLHPSINDEIPPVWWAIGHDSSDDLDVAKMPLITVRIAISIQCHPLSIIKSSHGKVGIKGAHWTQLRGIAVGSQAIAVGRAGARASFR